MHRRAEQVGGVFRSMKDGVKSMRASRASSSPASRAPEADGRLCMDLDVDLESCPGWSWEEAHISPTRLEVRSRAEESERFWGILPYAWRCRDSCGVPGVLLEQVWMQFLEAAAWGTGLSLPRILHVVPGSRRLSSRLTLCLGGADPQARVQHSCRMVFIRFLPRSGPGNTGL